MDRRNRDRLHSKRKESIVSELEPNIRIKNANDYLIKGIHILTYNYLVKAMINKTKLNSKEIQLNKLVNIYQRCLNSLLSKNFNKLLNMTKLSHKNKNKNKIFIGLLLLNLKKIKNRILGRSFNKWKNDVKEYDNSVLKDKEDASKMIKKISLFLNVSNNKLLEKEYINKWFDQSKKIKKGIHNNIINAIEEIKKQHCTFNGNKFLAKLDHLSFQNKFVTLYSKLIRKYPLYRNRKLKGAFQQWLNNINQTIQNENNLIKTKRILRSNIFRTEEYDTNFYFKKWKNTMIKLLFLDNKINNTNKALKKIKKIMISPTLNQIKREIKDNNKEKLFNKTIKKYLKKNDLKNLNSEYQKLKKINNKLSNNEYNNKILKNLIIYHNKKFNNYLLVNLMKSFHVWKDTANDQVNESTYKHNYEKDKKILLKQLVKNKENKHLDNINKNLIKYFLKWNSQKLLLIISDLLSEIKNRDLKNIIKHNYQINCKNKDKVIKKWKNKLDKYKQRDKELEKLNNLSKQRIKKIVLNDLINNNNELINQQKQNDYKMNLLKLCIKNKGKFNKENLKEHFYNWVNVKNKIIGKENEDNLKNKIFNKTLKNRIKFLDNNKENIKNQAFKRWKINSNFLQKNESLLKSKTKENIYDKIIYQLTGLLKKSNSKNIKNYFNKWLRKIEEMNNKMYKDKVLKSTCNKKIKKDKNNNLQKLNSYFLKWKLTKENPIKIYKRIKNLTENVPKLNNILCKYYAPFFINKLIDKTTDYKEILYNLIDEYINKILRYELITIPIDELVHVLKGIYKIRKMSSNIIYKFIIGNKEIKNQIIHLRSNMLLRKYLIKKYDQKISFISSSLKRWKNLEKLNKNAKIIQKFIGKVEDKNHSNNMNEFINNLLRIYRERSFIINREIRNNGILIRNLFHDYPIIRAKRIFEKLQYLSNKRANIKDIEDQTIKLKKDELDKQNLLTFVNNIKKIYTLRKLDKLFIILKKVRYKKSIYKFIKLLYKKIKEEDRYSYMIPKSGQGKCIVNNEKFKSSSINPNSIQMNLELKDNYIVILPYFVDYLNQIVNRCKKDVIQYWRSFRAPKVYKAILNYANKKMIERKKEFIEGLNNKSKEKKKDENKYKIIYLFFRKYFIYNIVKYLRKPEILMKLKYITRLIFMHKHIAEQRNLRYIIRNWRFYAFVRIASKKKIELLSKNVKLIFNNIIGNLFGNDIDNMLNNNSNSIIKDFKNFGNDIGMFENEDPSLDTEKKYCKKYFKKYIFDNENDKDNNENNNYILYKNLEDFNFSNIVNNKNSTIKNNSNIINYHNNLNSNNANKINHTKITSLRGPKRNGENQLKNKESPKKKKVKKENI